MLQPLSVIRLVGNLSWPSIGDSRRGGHDFSRTWLRQGQKSSSSCPNPPPVGIDPDSVGFIPRLLSVLVGALQNLLWIRHFGPPIGLPMNYRKSTNPSITVTFWRTKTCGVIYTSKAETCTHFDEKTSL